MKLFQREIEDTVYECRHYMRCYGKIPDITIFSLNEKPELFYGIRENILLSFGERVRISVGLIPQKIKIHTTSKTEPEDYKAIKVLDVKRLENSNGRLRDLVSKLKSQSL